MTDARLERWSLLVTRRPGRVACCTALLGAVFIYSLTNIHFDNDIRSTVPTPSGLVLDRIDEIFGLREQSFVLIECPEPESQSVLLRIARDLEAKLAGHELIAKVDYGHAELRNVVLDNLAPYGPRFAHSANAPEIGSLFNATDLDDRLEHQLSRLAMPGFGDTEAFVLKDPLNLSAFLFDRLAAARGTYRIDPSSPYTISADGRAILIRIQGSRSLDDLGAAQATALAIEEALAQVERPALFRAAMGGGHFLALESGRIVRRDLIVSLTLSLCLVLWLTGWTLRSFQAGFLVFPPLTIGLLSGVGLLGLIKSRMTLLALGSSAILIGLGVDFAIHFLLRARAERAAGLDPETSVTRAMGTAGPGLVFAALTTMGAFLAFHASDFVFLKDMGSLTALGILGTLVATLSLLPPLASRWLRTDTGAPRTLGVDAVVVWSTRHARTVLITAGLVSAGTVGYLVVSPPEMENDLRRIHAHNSRALRAEERMSAIFGGDEEPLFLLLENPGEAALEQNLRKLRDVLDQLVSDGHLVSYQSAAMLLPDRNVEDAVQARLGPMSAEELHLRIGAALDRAGFDGVALKEAVERIVKASTDRRPLSLARLRELGLGEWLGHFVRQLPESSTTVALSTIYPAKDLWVPAHRSETLERIDDALASAGVTADVSGMVTVSTEAGMQISKEMATVGSLALVATVILVALLFRSPGITLLVLVPVTLGCLWTALGFRLCDFRLHFMNASVLPMILGIGIDDGIHLVKRFRSLSHGFDGTAEDLVRRTFSVTGTGVALTSLTTMIAFGSLGLSENRGLASIGILALIGVGASLVASVTVLPAVMVAARRRAAATAGRRTASGN